jgi:hypothetical protein
MRLTTLSFENVFKKLAEEWNRDGKVLWNKRVAKRIIKVVLLMDRVENSLFIVHP